MTELGDHHPEWADVRHGRGIVVGAIFGLLTWATVATVASVVLVAVS